jgi:tetratricopeptide (TPR) repeat protein
MNSIMTKKIFPAFAAAFMAYALFLFLFPELSYSARLYHTISISSFSNIAPAEKQFESLTKTLQEQDLDHLRIEKIGKFYCVRLGKFDDKASADKIYNEVKEKLPGGTIMTAYIKDERIVKLYSGAASAESPEEKTRPRPVPVPEPEQQKLEKDRKAEQPEKASTLEESLAKVPSLVHKKDYKAALDVLTPEIAQHPEQPELNAWLGMVYLKMDRPSESLPYLTKAAGLSPDIPDYHNSLGYSLLFLSRFDQAIHEFNEAIKLDPDYYDSLTGLCMSYAKKGDKAEAMKIYNKIREYDKPTSDKLLQIIGQ